MAFTQISTDGIKNGTITGSDLATNIDLVDNQKLRVGTGNDLLVWHNGSTSLIQSASHPLAYYANTRHHFLNGDGSENMAVFVADGQCELYHNGLKKFETTSSGAKWTGDLTCDDNNKIRIGSSGDLNLFHDGDDSIIENTTGDIEIRGAGTGVGNVLLRPKTGENGVIVKPDNAVELYYDNSKKFETTSNGILISGFTDARQDSTGAYSASAAPGNLLARFYNGSAQDDSHTAIQLRASNDNGAADMWYMTCVSQSQNYNGALTFTARTTSSSYQELVRFANNGRVSMQVLALGSGNSHDSAKLVIQGTGNSTSTNSVFVKNSDETPLFQLRNDGAFFTGIDGTSPHNLTTSTNANLVVTSDGVLRRSTSSVRYKKDIADATFGLADVLKLKPKTFKNNATGEFADDKTYAGFTAEDIHDLGLTEFVQYNEANEPDALAYGNMVALMAKAIQDLNAKVEALEAG